MKKKLLKIWAAAFAIALATSVPIVASAAGAGTDIMPNNVRACVNHDWRIIVTNRECWYYDADTHTVGEFLSLYCLKCTQDTTDYRTYTESHSYNYNYNTLYWECECGDSYQHN